MGKHLISLGHGRSKAGAYDSGATGNGTTEAEWLRGAFLVSLKKYATKVGNIDFYENNMFADRAASTVSGYDDVTELHLDAAASTAKGGHVIVKIGMGTDVTDENLRNVVQNNFGIVGYTKENRGFSYRDDLLNLNVFATRGISYRLVELCFITNASDMCYFKANYDKVAKELIEAISGVSIMQEQTFAKKDFIWTKKHGRFTPYGETGFVRDHPDATLDSSGVYKAGESVEYDSWGYDGQYVWIHWYDKGDCYMISGRPADDWGFIEDLN